MTDNKKSLEEVYNSCLVEIMMGNLDHESEARSLAEEHRYSMDELEGCLEEGHLEEYRKCLQYIGSGFMEYKSEAIKLAGKHGYSIPILKRALELGYQVKIEQDLAELKEPGF